MTTENLVSITITPEEEEKINQAIDDLNKTLKPKLIALTNESRREIPKMGDGTEPFVSKAMDYATSNPEFAPAFVDVSEMAIDLTATKDLTNMYRPLVQLIQQLDDSIMLSGSEAYRAALAYYNSVKLAAKMNVNNAKPIYDDLKKRFSKVTSTPVVTEKNE